MTALHEQHRPTSLDTVVGQSKAVQKVRTVLQRSWGGRAWFITGPSGTGKTTLARIIAATGADELNTWELDAAALTPAALREIEDGLRFRAMGQKSGKAFIVNEAHGLRRDTVRQLLVLLERLPAHATFVFTTTRAVQVNLFDDTDDDSGPLVSRCTLVQLEAGPETRRAFAERARAIAVKEGIDGVPLEAYAAACDQCRGNFRQLLGQVESGAVNDDARQRAGWQKELDMLRSTKGDRAAARRAELQALLGNGGAA